MPLSAFVPGKVNMDMFKIQLIKSSKTGHWRVYFGNKTIGDIKFSTRRYKFFPTTVEIEGWQLQEILNFIALRNQERHSLEAAQSTF